MPTFVSTVSASVRISAILAAALALGLLAPSLAAAADIKSISITQERADFHEEPSTSHTHTRGAELKAAFLASPLRGERFEISSNFGPRFHPVLSKRRNHNGVDFTAPKGSPIRTAADGIITFIGQKKGYGKVIMVDHGPELSTLYAHQSKFATGLKRGSTVQQGTVIGYVGSTGTATGNNLHFEVHIDGKPVNPLNAERLIAEYKNRTNRLN